METPLVPQELSGGTRKLLTVGVFLVFTFVLITVCLTIWYGFGEYHGGFVIVAISTIILLVCTGVLINLMRQDKLEDKVKYVTLAQSLGLILLSASLFAVIFGPTAAATYSVGGSVSGLQSAGLELTNDVDKQVVSQFDTSCGPWTFPKKFSDGAQWRMVISKQPSDAECVIMSGGTGSVKGKDSTAIRVVCTVKYTIGGNVGGLPNPATEPVILQQVGGGGRDSVSVSANGPFVFPTAVPPQTQYQVTVQTNPRGMTCTVTSGTGTVTNQPITNVMVTCSNG